MAVGWKMARNSVVRAAAGVAAGVAAMGSAATALAETPASSKAPDSLKDQSAIAHYRGEDVRMADGIPAGVSCAVVSGKEAYCFDTAEDLYGSGLVERPPLNLVRVDNPSKLPAASSTVGGGPVAQASGPVTCSSTGSLYLYEDINYGGAVITFPYNFGVPGQDFDLGNYGWSDRASSWKNAHCYSHVGLDNWPGGGAYTWFNAGYMVDWMGSMSDRVTTLRW